MRLSEPRWHCGSNRSNPYFGEPKAALIQAGADLKIRDNLGRTALFDQQYATSATVLIKAGLNVNAADLTGETPLEVTPREEVALALLDAGARVPKDPEHLKRLTARATKMHWTKVLPRLGESNGGNGPIRMGDSLSKR
jgi:hypothetical protein